MEGEKKNEGKRTSPGTKRRETLMRERNEQVKVDVDGNACARTDNGEVN